MARKRTVVLSSVAILLVALVAPALAAEQPPEAPEVVITTVDFSTELQLLEANAFEFTGSLGGHPCGDFRVNCSFFPIGTPCGIPSGWQPGDPLCACDGPGVDDCAAP